MPMHPLPSRVRVLVIGGGIHGVGVLHDLVSRGWRDTFLIEKGRLGLATSARSTKLIHGGLRYLAHLRDWALVREALAERRLLLQLIPDLVSPVELILPVLKGSGPNGLLMGAGLSLYDVFAGRTSVARHQRLDVSALRRRVPALRHDQVKFGYSFWDAQTDDLCLVERVAASAVRLGGSYSEGMEALEVRPDADGWEVLVRNTSTGNVQSTRALYVVNCAGPWSNVLLQRSPGLMKPSVEGLNNKGIHLLTEDLGLSVGLFLQSPEDRRIFFVLPWRGYTLVGTTESLFDGNPDEVVANQSEVSYLVERLTRYLDVPFSESKIVGVSAGLRWLPVEGHRSLSDTSRSDVIDEKVGTRGLCLTIYGGKLTTYRRLAESIGDRITQHFGEVTPSRTSLPEVWARPDGHHASPRPEIGLGRFVPIQQIDER